MILRFPGSSGPAVVNIKEGAVTVSPQFGESYAFDRAGRLISMFTDGRYLRRSLDNRLIEHHSERRDGLRVRRFWPLEDVTGPLTRMQERLAQIAAWARASDLNGVRREQLLAALDAVMGPEELQADAARFAQVYEPIGILPPDQYLALALQATLGGHWNACTFCGFYRGRAFRIRTVAAFERHCREVRAYLGRGGSRRRSLFLADANALVMPQERALAMLQAARRIFPEVKGGVYSFASAADSLRKTAADWRALAAAGLRRVYVGLETGDDELLEFLRKPTTAQEAVEAVNEMKAGGVSVGVIVMLGIGGRSFGPAHVAGSAAALSGMELGQGDLVYFSPFFPDPRTEYPALAARAGLEPLSEAEMLAQRRAITAATRFRGRGPQLALYDVRTFAY